MKTREFLFTCVISLILTSCGSGQMASVSDDLPLGIELISYDDDSGLAHAVKKSGDAVVMEGEVLDGQMHGSWASYDNSGALTSLVTYNQGMKEGVALTFDKQGYLSVKESYHNGLLHGETKMYSRKRVTEEKYYEKGQLEGMVTKYYTSGKIMQEAPFKNGKMDGIAKWYDESGELSFAYEYSDGELIDKNPKLD